MSTVAVYNGFGKYETREGERGIMLKYAGLDFWLPFQKVTYFPDYLLREIDWNESTGNDGEERPMAFKTIRVSGERLVEELLETQIPTPNSAKGIIIVKGKKTTFVTSVLAGRDESGAKVETEVHTIEPTAEEIQKAESLARAYKEQTIQEYFQSKRERMAGGHGQIFPTGIVKVFMDELGVKDIDDVTKQTSGQSDLQELARLLRQPAPAPVPVAPVKESLSSLI